VPAVTRHVEVHKPVESTRNYRATLDWHTLALDCWTLLGVPNVTTMPTDVPTSYDSMSQLVTTVLKMIYIYDYLTTNYDFL